jgi:hypothetical protein
MENNKPARPWDLFNKNLGRVTSDVLETRLSICKECPRFMNLTKQCKECGCIMTAKAKLPNASCPLGKWGTEKISYKEIQ